jgi:hypothetical protein
MVFLNATSNSALLVESIKGMMIYSSKKFQSYSTEKSGNARGGVKNFSRITDFVKWEFPCIQSRLFYRVSKTYSYAHQENASYTVNAILEITKIIYINA